MMVIDNSGNVFSRDSAFGSWVQQVSGGGAKAIDIGYTGRLMIIDSTGRAYVKDGTQDNWGALTSPTGAKAIAIG
jgi:hypothetical protein